MTDYTAQPHMVALMAVYAAPKPPRMGSTRSERRRWRALADEQSRWMIYWASTGDWRKVGLASPHCIRLAPTARTRRLSGLALEVALLAMCGRYR